ncbi:MAG: glycyl-radical enzyme activating protein [Eubacterium sp.]|nr:glycyl-radical enzyme activating protein [Eubacterium sp.]
MEEIRGIVFDISHYMLEDGPGIRTNVFLKGCPLRCKWCSNAYGLKREKQMAYNALDCIGCGTCESVCPNQAISMDGKKKVSVTDFTRCVNCMRCINVCPTKARVQIGREYSVKEVVREVLKDRLYYRRDGGGVTLSGGEILMQPGFAYEILKSCIREGISTAIETSAYGRWEDLEKILTETDTAFIDCKCMDGKKHKEITGVDNKVIISNIKNAAKFCEQRKVCLVIRLPLIPGYNDDQTNILSTAEFVKHLPGTPLLNVLPYHNYGEMKYERIGYEYTLKQVKIPDKKMLNDVRRLLEEAKVEYSIGGYNIK